MAWPSPLRGALHTGLALGQARAAPLEAGPGVCDLKKGNCPHKYPPLYPQMPSLSYSDPHLSELGRLPSQEQEGGWEHLNIRNKTLEETA